MACIAVFGVAVSASEFFVWDAGYLHEAVVGFVPVAHPFGCEVQAVLVERIDHACEFIWCSFLRCFDIFFNRGGTAGKNP
jgi:hypothetical protein